MALVKEFSVKNVYQNLILELNQLKQGALELVREYKEKTMTLQNKLQGCFRAQGHEGIYPIFAGSMHWCQNISPLVCYQSCDNK
jgi:hypothetical protein